MEMLMKRTMSTTAFVFLLSFMFLACPSTNDDSDDDEIWLAELSNPFLGKWESDIPSASMHLIFDYKTDGTFDYEIPGLSADQGGKGKGGYLVKDNVMVSYLSFEGVAGYTFKVIDNDTIDVTEIEEINENGSFKLGNTAPFTRVAGSEVNKENKPFVLTHPYLGKWQFKAENMEIPEFGAGKHNIETNYEARAGGILAYEFKLDNNPPMSELVSYFIFDNVLVVYDVAEGFEIATITAADNNQNTIYLAEEGETPVLLTRVP
jgi:hypothetical protein